MENAEGAIHSLFHDHLGGPHTILHLIELSTVGHGPIPAQHPSGLQCEHGSHLDPGWQGPMQVGAVRWLDGKASVVLRQPGRQEPIRLSQGGDARHMIDPLRPQPAPQGLIAEREAMILATCSTANVGPKSP